MANANFLHWLSLYWGILKWPSLGEFGWPPGPSFDKSAKLSKQRSTRVLVQQPLTPEIIPCEGDAQGGGDLILPETLLPEERQAALVLVRRCAPNAQALLDELSARIQACLLYTSRCV